MHRLLRQQGLERYYALRGDRGLPVGEMHLERRDRKWLELVEADLGGDAGTGRVQLDVQGIHCSACVWLIEELFRREPGGLRIIVNPAVGKCDLAVDASFPLRRFVQSVESFGYLLGPSLKDPANRKRADDLLIRTGICIALAVNGMTFAAAIHLGLRHGPVYTFMSQLGWAAALLAVLVGGPVFFRAAWQGLRRGVLHLDLPIAIGIALAFAGSTWSFFVRGGAATYVDSVAAFIALMLLGRWLQERVLRSNRDRLLASDGTEGLLARRLDGGHVKLVPCRDIAEGDELMVAPGDLVPVAAKLERQPASVSLDWINGESAPRDLPVGATVPAGAFNAGASAVRLRAAEAFEQSMITELLRRPAPEELDGTRPSDPWWRRISTAYVIAVLLAAAGGLAGWWIASGSLARALEVATAVLVVTCPCAFGIATPLAYEMVQARLRRYGLLVRSSTFLDRLRHVRRVVFDKTGTLTDGVLHLQDPAALEALAPQERRALYALVAQSAHPKSVAVKRALEDMADPPELLDGVRVTEKPGLGLEACIDGQVHRVGSPRWAGGGEGDLVYSVDGVVRAKLDTQEALRPDAREQVDGLQREGFDLWILSGDSPERTRKLAAELGFGEERGVGGCSPADKADWVRSHDPDQTLFIGEGLNDGPAADAAACAGTPAVDRPFMAARCDFFFVTPGLSPVTQALRASADLTQAVHRNLVFAVAYNVIALSLAWAGFMQPWLAAVLMPASSLASLGMTAASLSERSPSWKS